jgi:hypothetical protein
MALEKLLPIYGCAAKRPSAARRSALEFGALTNRGLLEYSSNDLASTAENAQRLRRAMPSDALRLADRVVDAAQQINPESPLRQINPNRL